MSLDLPTTLKKRKVIVVVLLAVVTLGFYENYLFWTYLEALLGDQPKQRRRWGLVNTAGVIVLAAFLLVVGIEALTPDQNLDRLDRVLQLLSLALNTSVAFKVRQQLNHRVFRRPGDPFVGRFRTLYFGVFYLQFAINRSFKTQGVPHVHVESL